MASYPKYLSDEQCQHLTANGVRGWDPERFAQSGVTDPAQMLHLTANGVCGWDAKGFTQAGITDPAQMLHLAANGVRGWDAWTFTQAGITDHAQMISLARLDPGDAVLSRIPAARFHAGYVLVDRVLSAGVRLGRFPNGTLTGLSRRSKIAAELTELSDEALDVTITLTEDEFDATGDISVARIRETLNIIH